MRRGDDRAVSETTGVATLVLLTVLVTASVGISVLFVEGGSGGPSIDADFQFEYFGGQGSLLITYNDGKELVARNVTVSAHGTNVTWAQLANLNGTATIAPGDRVQLRQNNAYNRRVTPGTNVTLLYAEGGNTTVVDSYRVNATSS